MAEEKVIPKTYGLLQSQLDHVRAVRAANPWMTNDSTAVRLIIEEWAATRTPTQDTPR
jgi:hypothetical protein